MNDDVVRLRCYGPVPHRSHNVNPWKDISTIIISLLLSTHFVCSAGVSL